MTLEDIDMIANLREMASMATVHKDAVLVRKSYLRKVADRLEHLTDKCSDAEPICDPFQD